MKIALIGLSHPFRGGIAHYTTALQQALKQRHRCFLFGFKRQYPEFLFPGKTQKDTSQTSFQTDDSIACLDSINPLSWWQTYRQIKRYQPSHVLFSWWHPFFAPGYSVLSYLLSRHAAIPCYFLCHNVLPHEQSFLDRTLVRCAFAFSQGFVVHAEQQAEQIRCLTKQPVWINPHPNYDCFTNSNTWERKTSRRQLQLDGKRVLLFFGLIRPYKGLSYLLEAMLQLDSNYHLLLVGEFYEPIQHYQTQLNRLQQRGQITLVDRYVANEEVGLYFTAADIFIAPYIEATQSGVIQIAFSFNIPVIAARVGGLPEMIEPDKTGFLVPAKDSGALRQAIRRFFQQADRKLFQQAIQQRQYRFSWSHMVDTIERMMQN